MKDYHYKLRGASVFTKKYLANPPARGIFLTRSATSVLYRKGNSNNFFVLNAPYFQELVTSTVFDGCMGIQSTNEMDVCCPNHSL